MNLEWMGYLAAACTTPSFVPQAAKTIRTRDTSGISLWMYVVFTFGIACWFGYGLFPAVVADDRVERDHLRCCRRRSRSG